MPKEDPTNKGGVSRFRVCENLDRRKVLNEQKRKEDLIYVGIDLHKESHTAVILDCWNTKLGEITFANTPAEFPKLIRKVNKFCTENKEPVYGLENAYGYGRGLAVWLIAKDLMVKDVNTSLAHRQAKCRAMYKKATVTMLKPSPLPALTCCIHCQMPVQTMPTGHFPKWLIAETTS